MGKTYRHNDFRTMRKTKYVKHNRHTTVEGHEEMRDFDALWEKFGYKSDVSGRRHSAAHRDSARKNKKFCKRKQKHSENNKARRDYENYE